MLVVILPLVLTSGPFVLDYQDEPEVRVLCILVDDKAQSQGVLRQIERRSRLVPDSSQLEGYTIKVITVQGFHPEAPAWSTYSRGGAWTPILHWCPCGGMWEELTYYVQYHKAMVLWPVYEYTPAPINGRALFYRRLTGVPNPPTRAIVVRDLVLPVISRRVWR